MKKSFIRIFSCFMAFFFAFSITDIDVSAAKSTSNNKLDVYESRWGGNYIVLEWKENPKTARYTVYIYDNKKEAYVKYKDGTSDIGLETISNVKPETTYKVLLRLYDKNDKILFSGKGPCTTKLAIPKVDVKKTDKAVVQIDSRSKHGVGYEVYLKEQSYDDYQTYWYKEGMSLDSLKDWGFKLGYRSSDKASGSLTLKKGKSYTVAVRTIASVNGKKKYSDFSYPYNTAAPSAYVNGLTLNPKAVCRGEELELVKKYVNSVITDDMSNYDKMREIFNLVHSHGEYQEDINKIDGNRSVWQIMEKQEGQCASWAFCLDAMLEYAGFDVKVVRALRDSGQQHFWCQIYLDGNWYNLDAHLGSFLSGPYVDSYIGYKVVETY